MRVDPEQREAGMPPYLRRQSRDCGAVVATQHGQERVGRDLGQALHRAHPSGLDVPPGVEVADVADTQAGQEVALFGDGRHHRGQLADGPGRDGGALSVDGRAIVGDARDHDVSRLPAYQPCPRTYTVEVHTLLLFSGTFRMQSDPITNKTAKTLKTTGKHPGTQRIRG